MPKLVNSHLQLQPLLVAPTALHVLLALPALPALTTLPALLPPPVLPTLPVLPALTTLQALPIPQACQPCNPDIVLFRYPNISIS